MSSASPTRRAFTFAAMAAPLLAKAAQAQTALDPDSAARASEIAQAVFSGPPAPVPALSLAVANAGGVIWAEALGKADLEFDVSATPGHMFRLGSVSKVVTATAAARLVSRGVLDLDTPIATWLPDLPEHHRQTTLRQLLTHRGGVRHYIPRDFDLQSPGGPLDVRTYLSTTDALALFIDDPLVAPAGTQVSYSSFGFTLASAAMEAAAGQSFTQLIKTEIGEAFELPSLVEDDPVAITPLRASGYMNAFDARLLYGAVAPGMLAKYPQLTGGWGNIRQSNPAYSWAGAGFLMTPSDLARFGAAMLDIPNMKISAAERALLFTPMTEATDDLPPLGLGWRIDADAKGRLRWHHAGATPGGRANIAVYPELGLSVAMASNVMSVPGDVLGPSSDLADVFT